MSAAARTVLRNARLVAGPAALTGFFLPWTDGSGILRGESFSGFELLRISGALRALDLPTEQTAGLVLVRGLLLALPVAAVWFTLLAPALRAHWAYRVSAAYLLLSTAFLGSYAAIAQGVIVPRPGLALLICAALAIVVSALASRIPARHQQWQSRGYETTASPALLD